MDKQTRNYCILFTLINAIMFISSSVLGPYLSSYYYDKGLSASEIGYLLAVGPLTAIIFQPMWASVCDRTGNRKRILQILLLGAMASVLLYLPMESFWGFALATFFFSIFNSSINPIFDAESIHFLHKAGVSFSLIRMGGTVGYSISVFVVGSFLRANPARSFPLTTACMIVFIVLVCFLPRQTNTPAAKQRARGGLKELLGNKAFMFMVAFCFIFQLALGYCGSFTGVLVREMGYTNFELGICMMVSAASEIPILLTVDRLIRRFGEIPLLLVAGFAIAVRSLFLVVATNLPGVLAAQMMQGPSYMLVYYCSVLYVHKRVSTRLYTSAQSFLALAQGGFGSIVGNIMGGYLSDALGIRGGLSVVASFVAGCACVLAVVYRSSPGFRQMLAEPKAQEVAE